MKLTKLEEQNLKNEMRVKMVKMMEDKIKELDDVLGDMLDDLAADLDYGPGQDTEDQEAEAFANYCDLQEEVQDAAIRQFGTKLMGGTVWAMLAFDPEYGVHMEFWDERPHTADGNPENWPKWFRLYEGNINGGDSILVDSRGRNLSD